MLGPGAVWVREQKGRVCCTGGLWGDRGPGEENGRPQVQITIYNINRETLRQETAQSLHFFKGGIS